MKNKVIVAVVVLVVAGGAFFGGMKFQESKTPARGQFANRMGMGRFGMGQNSDPNTRPVSGDITAADDKQSLGPDGLKSITVKLADGSSKIVLYSGTTKLSKPSDASKDDLKTGTRVFVLGKQNSDGSVTADNIQVNFGQGR